MPFHRLTATRSGGGLGALVLLPLTTLAGAAALPITIDGAFDDWSGASQIGADVTGDGGSSGIDFGRVWAANDELRLFLRFEVGAERNLQWNNGITLCIDSDDNPNTGRAVAGIGAEIEFQFGALMGMTHTAAGDIGIGWQTLGLRQGPTVSGREFEIAIDRSAEVFGQPLFPPSPRIRIALIDVTDGSQDLTPDVPPGMAYVFNATPVPPPTPTPLARAAGTDVRLMTYNVEFDGLFTRPDPHTRIIAAIDPDVICFQELYGSSVEHTRERVQGVLGGTWHAAGVGDCITVSRLPILSADDIDQNIATILALPPGAPHQAMCVINTHLPSGSNDAGRRLEIDHIIAWIRELRTPGGAELPPGTPIVIAGDMNFISAASQPRALLTGNIFDEATNGPDMPPDWDDSSLTLMGTAHVAEREIYTWRSDTSPFWPTPIDLVMFTDSVITLRRGFILSTQAMSASQLLSAGLEKGDTAAASDHRPVVADLSFLPFAAFTGIAFH